MAHILTTFYPYLISMLQSTLCYESFVWKFSITTHRLTSLQSLNSYWHVFWATHYQSCFCCFFASLNDVFGIFNPHSGKNCTLFVMFCFPSEDFELPIGLYDVYLGGFPDLRCHVLLFFKCGWWWRHKLYTQESKVQLCWVAWGSFSRRVFQGYAHTCCLQNYCCSCCVPSIFCVINLWRISFYGLVSLSAVYHTPVTMLIWPQPSEHHMTWFGWMPIGSLIATYADWLIGICMSAMGTASYGFQIFRLSFQFVEFLDRPS